MGNPGSMRRVWMGLSAAVAVLALYPAWTGRTSWWLFGISTAIFLVFLLEPWFLTWEIRKRGDSLQITDDGILRRLVNGSTEYVRWTELREVVLVTTHGMNVAGDYFYVLAGTGRAGVLIGQDLAARHDLLSHLAKLPGFDHRGIATAMGSTGNQRILLWRAKAIEGQAQLLPPRGLEPPTEPGSPTTLH
jgi:hypothetical protein